MLEEGLVCAGEEHDRRPPHEASSSDPSGRIAAQTQIHILLEGTERVSLLCDGSGGDGPDCRLISRDCQLLARILARGTEVESGVGGWLYFGSRED